MWCIFKNLKRVCALFIYDHNDIQADVKIQTEVLKATE